MLQNPEIERFVLAGLVWVKRSGSMILLLVAAHLERDFHLAFSAIAHGLLALQIRGLFPLIEDGFRLNFAFASVIAMERFADGTRHKHLSYAESPTQRTERVPLPSV